MSKALEWLGRVLPSLGHLAHVAVVYCLACVSGKFGNMRIGQIQHYNTMKM